MPLTWAAVGVQRGGLHGALVLWRVEKPVDTRRLLSLIDELRSGRPAAQA